MKVQRSKPKSLPKYALRAQNRDSEAGNSSGNARSMQEIVFFMQMTLVDTVQLKTHRTADALPR